MPDANSDSLYTQAQLEQQLARLLRVQELRRGSGSVRRESARNSEILDALTLRVQQVEAEVTALNHYLTGEPNRPGDIGILGRILVDIAAIPDRVSAAIREAQVIREVSTAQMIGKGFWWVIGAVIVAVSAAAISHFFWH